MTIFSYIKNLFSLLGKKIKLKIFTTLQSSIYRYKKLSFDVPFNYNSISFKILAYFASDEIQKNIVFFRAVQAGDVKRASQIFERFKGQIDINTHICRFRSSQSSFNSFHLATSSIFWHPDMVQKLIDFGANINIKDSQGNTALHRSFWKMENFIDPGLHKFLEEIIRNREKVVRILIEKGIDKNVKDKDGKTLLQKIIEIPNLPPNQIKLYFPFIKILATNAIDILTRDDLGNTILHTAVSSQNLEFVKYFLDLAPEAINIKNHNHKTPLDLQGAYSSAEMLNSLLEAKITPPFEEEFKQFHKNKAFFCAIKQGNNGLAKKMIERFGKELTKIKDPEGNTALAIAANHGKLETMRMLLSMSIEPQDKSETMEILSLLPIESRNKPEEKIRQSCEEKLFFHAIEKGSVVLVKKMVEEFGNKLTEARDKEGNTALCIAARNAYASDDLTNSNYNAIISFLEEKTADKEARDAAGQNYKDIMLNSAIEGPMTEATRHSLITNWINQGAIISNATLTKAMARGDLETVKFLTKFSSDKYRINPDDQDKDGNSLLHLAAPHMHVGLIDFLIEKKANIKIKNTIGQTYSDILLHSASIAGNIKLVKNSIEERQANVNSQDKEGNTALHKAALYRRLKSIDFLIKNGADITTKNKIGQTYSDVLLCSAAKAGNLELVKNSVEQRHANINAQNSEGKTALHFAAKSPNQEIAKFLNSKKAPQNKLHR